MASFFYTLIATITFFAFLHALADKVYNISRTVIINKPRDEVFNFLKQLKKEHLWMPWFAEDFKGVLKFLGEDGEEGTCLYWNGHSLFYEGTQKITKLHQSKIIETRFTVIRPIRLIFIEYKGIKEIDHKSTKLVWGIRGSLAFPLSIISLFRSVDNEYGPALEAGLRNMKNVLEAKKPNDKVSESGMY